MSKVEELIDMAIFHLDSAYFLLDSILCMLSTEMKEGDVELSQPVYN